MARLEGPDRRHFEIIPHPEFRGENALALFVGSISAGGYVRVKYWGFAEVAKALESYRSARGRR